MNVWRIKDLPALYRTLGERYAQLDDWSMYLITSYENAQQDIGRKADKNRKIYNGMMKTYFYQYQGQTAEESKAGRAGKKMKQIIFATGNAGK